MRVLGSIVMLVGLTSGCGLVLDFTPEGAGTSSGGGGGASTTNSGVSSSGATAPAQGGGGQGGAGPAQAASGAGSGSDLDGGDVGGGTNGRACGDGEHDLALGEECDDGNAESADGCSGCQLECVSPEIPRAATASCLLQSADTRPSWDVAREECRKTGGDLALLGDRDLGDGEHREGIFFVGARRANVDAPWLWLDGAQLELEGREGESELCAAIELTAEAVSPQLFAVPCEGEHRYFCERDPTEPRP